MIIFTREQDGLLFEKVHHVRFEFILWDTEDYLKEHTMQVHYDDVEHNFSG